MPGRCFLHRKRARLKAKRAPTRLVLLLSRQSSEDAWGHAAKAEIRMAECGTKPSLRAPIRGESFIIPHSSFDDIIRRCVGTCQPERPPVRKQCGRKFQSSEDAWGHANLTRSGRHALHMVRFNHPKMRGDMPTRPTAAGDCGFAVVSVSIIRRCVGDRKSVV